MAMYAQSAADGAASPTFGSSPAPPGTSTAAGQQEQPPGHKRVYQACIPCRRRKVRCDLGSVDNPHEPPCVRCRRESKDCYFSATRRKRKADEADGGVSDGEDDYIVRNGRKRHPASGSPPVSQLDRRLYSDVPLTPGGSIGRTQPLRRPHELESGSSTTPLQRAAGDFGDSVDGEANIPLENFEARTVMRREVYGPHDALELLYKAATDSPHKHETGRSHQQSDSVQPGLGRTHSQDHAVRSIPQTNNGMYSGRHSLQADVAVDQPIDPELTRDTRDIATEPGYAEAMKAWARFRFVRAGWFTAQEAIEYIEYYYKYLSPLTPISPPTFNNPASHLTLLTEEPILTVTLLTIASRYRRMPGAGGHCRSHAIHEQLWTYLRGMIERVVWGQEAFGGGFCHSGADETQTSSTAPWRGLRKGSLRTLGTIESLMILTEWHPRALHFPPSEAIDELLLPSYEGRDNMGADDDVNRGLAAGVGGRRIESWLEPAWRSDRMCWMLLSTGMGLAYELGVFDDIDELLAAGAITRPEFEEETYRLRAYRIKRLLLIYLTQLAGRLGWTSMVPEGLRKADASAASRRRPTSAVEGTTPGTNPSIMSNAFNYIPDLELDDQIIHCWGGISNAMHTGNEKLFRSRKHTTDIIQSGKYTNLLRDFQPLLRDWWKEFERFKLPTFIRHVLTIEYEYVRIYINSLSLQAVVERCTSNAGNTAAGGSTSGNSAPQLSPQTQNYYGKLPLGQIGGFGAADQEYVKEVVDGCRNLLRTVVDGLLPGDYLKHAPVRTYFRIISGAMFLLKTFALGAPKSDVEQSIALMDRTVDALRTCVVDDVHLGIRFADLLESLTSRLRNRFIHAPPPAPSSLQATSTDGRSPNPHQAEAGAGANGHGASLANGPSDHLHWAKLNGPERSSTPANISATPFDASTGGFPYPSGSASMFGPSTPAATTGMDSSSNAHNGSGIGPDAMYGDNSEWSNNEMWYLPAGPAFFQNVGDSSVAMTAEGVNVAGIDLLDYMAMDAPGFPGMDGASSGY